jgi:hypothetical protein
MNETYRPSQPLLTALALWFCVQDINDPEMLVKRDDLALGLLEMGIVIGTKRKIIRSARATQIPESFPMREAPHKALTITLVCNTNQEWMTVFGTWYARHKEVLIKKGAVLG